MGSKRWPLRRWRMICMAPAVVFVEVFKRKGVPKKLRVRLLCALLVVLAAMVVTGTLAAYVYANGTAGVGATLNDVGWVAWTVPAEPRPSAGAPGRSRCSSAWTTSSD